MNYKLPLVITFCAGLLMILAEFIPHRPFGSISANIEIWFLIITGFAIILGQISLLKMNIIKVVYKLPNWKYHLATIISFSVMFLVGILYGMQKQPGLLGHGEWLSSALGDKPFDYIFANIYQHLMAAMFSILAFYIASAAYRAFIARTLDSTLLLSVSIIVMLGNTSFGTSLTAGLPQAIKFLHLPNLSSFIMDFPNTAGQRAILIGAGIGIIGSSLRIILGIERSWLGGK
ncbi:MAG: hypothetical protein FWG20_00885 [Candidatus Cloacimonetes bacterium]|nr:hypothetical protein [Candidatus Cloacimonadota bacterium]